MKCAIAQLNPIIGDIQGNTRQIKEKVFLAVDAGANLLLTPELSLCGYPPKDLILNGSFTEQMEIELERLAQEIPPQIYVLVGTVTVNTLALQKGEKPFYNTIALIHNGQIQQRFHKRLLPTYDVFEETRYFQSGHQANWLEFNGIKIGVTICEDLWNEENFWGKKHYNINPIKDLIDLKVDLIINLSASPYSVGKQKIRQAMLTHIAKQYQKPIIYVNQVGGNDDLIFDGNSSALNREGELVCRAKSYDHDLVYLNYDVANLNLSGTRLNHITCPEEEEIYNALVLGVKDYARKCGFHKAVIGLSGGIDSALVATIATSALGKENVFGVLMPSPYSSTHSITDAEALVKNLGIKSIQLPIQNIMESFDHTLEDLFANTEFGVTEENIQSRIRGTLLMAIANKFGYLLLSTSNKSEMSVGYCTLYGDMNGGLAVISDVPKTKVFSLCRWLNREVEVIPEHILTKPPSAELRPNQVDQDSLPPYDILDDILDRYLGKHQSISTIEEAGYDLAIITKIIKMVAKAEFKRKQAPPGLKITDRAFGTGWKMPIASRWYY